VTSNYCVPTALCTNTQFCAAATTPEELRACFERVPVVGARPAVVCRLPMQKDDTAILHLDPCGAAVSFSLDIDAHIGTRCIDDEKKPLLQLSPDGAPLAFADTITVDTSGGNDTRALTFKMKREAGCSYRVDWSGEAALLDRVPTRQYVRFSTAPVGGTSTHLVLPLELDLFDDTESECTSVPTCTVVGVEQAPDADLFACAR
jgi:hypothetical protein